MPGASAGEKVSKTIFSGGSTYTRCQEKMMGGCGNCDGDCSPEKKEACGDNCKCNSSRGRDPRKYQTDIKSYLRPLPSMITADSTPLTNWCTHNGTYKFKRYQCLECIKSYVWAVPYEETEETILHMKELGKVMAVERLENVLKERKLKEMKCV